MTLIHFGYIGKTSYFSLSPLPLPSFKTIHFGYIGNTFSFSPHHLPNPYHALWLCSILENFAKYFIFLSLPNPIPPPPNTLWFWSIWDILVKFFIFHAPLPSLPSSVTLIRFGHIGKVFHFSLIPSPLLSSFRKLHWSILEILLKHFIFPSPLPPLCSVTLIHFEHVFNFFNFFSKSPPHPYASWYFFLFIFYLLTISFWHNVYVIVLLFTVKILSYVNF